MKLANRERPVRNRRSQHDATNAGLIREEPHYGVSCHSRQGFLRLAQTLAAASFP